MRVKRGNKNFLLQQISQITQHQVMITHKINILPIIAKQKSKRLSLNRKQQSNKNCLIPSNNTIVSTNDQSKNYQPRQNLTFHIRKPRINSFKNKQMAFNLILETNQQILSKTAQNRNRSLSSLLMGRQFQERSRFSKKKSMKQLERRVSFFTTQVLKLTGIPLQQQKSTSPQDQKSNIGQLSMVRNYDFCSKNQIKQQQQKVQIEESENITAMPSNQVPQIKKQYVSVGVSTDFEIGTQSYKQFLKFKIMQSEKFDKIQNLFNQIDSICYSDTKLFAERQQTIRKLYQRSIENGRQKAVEDILKSKEQINNQIFQLLQLTVLELQNHRKSIFLQDISNVNIVHQHIDKKAQRRFSNCEKNSDFGESLEIKRIYSVEVNQPKENITQQELNQNLAQIIDQVKNFEERTNNSLDELTEKIVQKIKGIQSKFKQWKNLIKQKDFMLSLCIDDIIKLPEMSMIIFGMGEGASKQNQALKKIGVFLDDIPEWSRFCEKNRNLDNIQKQLGKILNMKCLNCSYLKSKMKYIQSKNKDLQSVIKILKHLTGG